MRVIRLAQIETQHETALARFFAEPARVRAGQRPAWEIGANALRPAHHDVTTEIFVIFRSYNLKSLFNSSIAIITNSE